jgi:hypothetical protein
MMVEHPCQVPVQGPDRVFGALQPEKAAWG